MDYGVWSMEAKQFLVEFVQVISVGQPSTTRENCPTTRGPAGKWTQERAGDRHRKTSEPRIQSWRRPAVARAGGGGAKRPTQREAPRTRSSAVSVLTSAKEQVQGVRGDEHLPASAHQEQVQGVRGGEHLPAPARKEHLQGVRGGEHLPAPAPKEQMHL